jgi:hypothetical protein
MDQIRGFLLLDPKVPAETAIVSTWSRSLKSEAMKTFQGFGTLDNRVRRRLWKIESDHFATHNRSYYE